MYPTHWTHTEDAHFRAPSSSNMCMQKAEMSVVTSLEGTESYRLCLGNIAWWDKQWRCAALHMAKGDTVELHGQTKCALGSSWVLLGTAKTGTCFLCRKGGPYPWYFQPYLNSWRTGFPQQMSLRRKKIRKRCKTLDSSKLDAWSPGLRTKPLQVFN